VRQIKPAQMTWAQYNLDLERSRQTPDVGYHVDDVILTDLFINKTNDNANYANVVQ